jgi:hypothetical protein
MKFLLDTNVFREIGKTSPHEHVGAWLAQVDDTDLAISALTVREVTKGVEKLRLRKLDVAAAIEARVQANFDAFGDRILPVDRDVSELWGSLLAASEKHIDDTGLAATARVHHLVLVTRNLADVVGRGVATLDPFKSSPKVKQA